jgi:hypothetical protein
MKKQFSILMLLLFVFTAIVSTSCKKDEDKKPKTREEMLVGKKWQIKAATVDPSITLPGGTTNNWYNQIPPCSKDDFVMFNSNGKFVDDEGGVKCSVNNPQTVQGDWLFNADKTVITLTYNPGETVSWTIKSLNDSELVGETQFDIGGTIYTITFTLRPI